MHADRVGNASPATQPELRVRESWQDGVVVVSAEDAVDQVTAPQLSRALSDALAQTPTGLIVDLTAVTFLASAGMTALVKAREQAGSTVRFGVVADGPTTSRPLKLLGLDDLLAIYPTLDEARRELH
jgi:anti-sigma B factor antagonist